MYAGPYTVTVTDRSAADAGLDQVVPQTSGLPGFVAGYAPGVTLDRDRIVVAEVLAHA